MKTENTNKKKAVVVIALVLLAIIGIILLAVRCTAEVDGGMEQTMTAAPEEVMDQLADESGQADADEASQSDVSIDAEPNTDTNSTESAAASEAQPSTSRQDAANANTTNGKPAATSGDSSSTSSTPSKHWVEETQRVWVEDRAAWNEQVPVYSTKEVSICNVCGQDITGNTSAHAKAHMMAGEGSGHHSEVRKTVSGYNTVNHPAEGHYETKVVGGHWE